MNDPIRVEIADGIATLTLTRPERRNALSRELLGAIRTTLGSVESCGARVVILAGEGSCFSAGADLADLEGTPADASFDDAVASTVAAVRTAGVGVLAAIEGACVGAALDLALACDARVAAAEAFFELPALRLGILYNPRAVERIRRVLPAPTVTRLLLLGERIEGRDALAAGIASHIAPAGQTVALAKALASRLTLVAPQAASAMKRFLAALDEPELEMGPWEAYRMELLGSPERRQALSRAKAKLGG
jgi:enoyl-CoA hydratase/carnithine racemase